MIQKESPLRRLPADMPVRQILFLDTARLSYEMAELSYKRLEQVLVELSREGTLGQRAVEATLHAYSFVDSAHRFRQAIMFFPGLRHDKGYKEFFAQTKALEEIRHVVQHQNREIDRMRQADQSSLGTITWLYVGEDDPKHSLRAYSLFAGTFFGGQQAIGPTIDLYSRRPERKPASVKLQVASKVVEFGPLLELLEKVIRIFETAVKSRSGSLELLGSDTLISMMLVPVVEGEDPPKAPPSKPL